MARSTPAVELDVRGRTVRVTNPDKVYFAEQGHHQAGRRAVLRLGRRRDPRRAVGPADHPGALAGRGVRGRETLDPVGPPGRRVLPEAGAAVRARLRRDGAHHLPQRPAGRRGLPDRARRRRLVREPRHPDLPPVAGPPLRPRPARPAADRPRPAAGHRLRRRRPGFHRGARSAGRARHAGLPEDVRWPRAARLRADRAALHVRAGQAGGDRARPGDRPPDARRR